MGGGERTRQERKGDSRGGEEEHQSDFIQKFEE